MLEHLLTSETETAWLVVRHTPQSTQYTLTVPDSLENNQIFILLCVCVCVCLSHTSRCLSCPHATQTNESEHQVWETHTHTHGDEVPTQLAHSDSLHKMMRLYYAMMAKLKNRYFRSEECHSLQMVKS